MANAAPIRKSVHRPAASATWRVTERWGHQIGDTRELSVTRFDGGALQISYGGSRIEIKEALVAQLAEMVAAAAVWSDKVLDG